MDENNEVVFGFGRFLFLDATKRHAYIRGAADALKKAMSETGAKTRDDLIKAGRPAQTKGMRRWLKAGIIS